MALSRSEIELLIKARNQAQGAFDQLNKQVTAVTGESAKASKSLDAVGTSARGAGAGATAAGVAFGLLAERIARGLVGAFNDSVRAANRLDAGLIGLSSVARAFNQDAGKAQAAAKALAADGLMSVGEAASGLKNLLASGFNLDQATTLMLRFKDSAAFGKQGALEFGQAIVGATEGIKNGNSIMVDNAGVTKNLSQILVEAGLSATDLSKASTDANVRLALFKGILKETNPQLGDTARFLDTTAGKQAQFSAQVDIAQQKIGKGLQPQLAALLQGLTPLVKIIGDNANVLVPLGFALGAVVTPLAALRVAAALGIPPIGALTAQVSSLVLAFRSGVAWTGSMRVGLNDMAGVAGLTTGNLGLLGSAVAVAGAAFVGWQLGRVIDELTGASTGVERLTVKLLGLSDAAVTQAAKQDVIQKAVKAGAVSTIAYTQAIEYNNRVEAIRIAQYDKSAAAQRARVDAELALGRVTLDTANAQRATIAAEEQTQKTRASRLTLTDSLAASEKAYQADIRATGYTAQELLAVLKTNETGFDAWAKQVNLSDATVKRLKDTLTEQNKVTTKHTADLKKLREAQDEIASSGEGWKGTLAGIDSALQTSIKGYLAAGVGQAALATAYNLTDTQVRALAKSLEEETKVQDKATAAIKKHLDALAEIQSTGDNWKGTLSGINQVLIDIVKRNLDAGVSQGALADAYGLTDAQIRAINKSLEENKRLQDITKRSAEETADLWQQHYGLIAAAAGTTADEQIAEVRRWAARELGELKQGDANWKAHYDAIQMVAADRIGAITNKTRIELNRQARDTEQHYAEMSAIFGVHSQKAIDAHKAMVAAQLAEAGKVPSFWATTVFPAVAETLHGIEREMGQTFAGMLTGATSFADGFKGIWQSIKRSVTDILGEILNTFIHSFLKGILGAMMGQQGAMSQAFAGIFSLAGVTGPGGGGGAGGYGPLLARLLGTAGGLGAGGIGVTAGLPAGLLAGTATGVGPGGVAVGGAAAQGAAGTATLLTGLLGGAAAGGAGIGFGLLGQRLFGGAGWKAGGFGAGAGAASGAAIGSVVPGIGTAVGAGVGALAGLISGLLGKSQTEKTNDLRDKFFLSLGMGGGGTGEGSAFSNLAGQLHKLGVTGDEMFTRLIKAAKMQDLKAAIEDVTTALDEQVKKETEAAKAAEENAAQRQKSIDVLKEKLTGIDTQLSDLAQSVANEAEEEVMGVTETLIREQMKVLDAQRAQVQAQLDAITDGAAAAAKAVQGAFDGVEVDIPVEYKYKNAPPGQETDETRYYGTDQGGEYRGAARGILAHGPNLVEFGEGGEAEVGGPASFFRKIFESLGIGTADGSALGGGVTVVFENIEINTLAGGSELVQTVRERVVPIVVGAIEDNVRGVRTRARAALGVT